MNPIPSSALQRNQQCTKSYLCPGCCSPVHEWMWCEPVGGFAYHACVDTCVCAGSTRFPRTLGSSQEAKTLQNKSVFPRQLLCELSSINL